MIKEINGNYLANKRLNNNDDLKPDKPLHRGLWYFSFLDWYNPSLLSCCSCTKAVRAIFLSYIS
jgi:hypothetical protein